MIGLTPMFALKFTDDPAVKRLRWVMMAAILFSIVNTLIGQPGSFWHHPETAIRGDGLSIHNATNHAFGFFLGWGWAPYLIASLTYFSAACYVVSILPRRMALITIFSFIFGHYFGASLWLAVRWHLGLTGSFLYGASLSAAMVILTFPMLEVPSDILVKRLRWLMVGAILLDVINTLLGQPISFWTRPETCQEANSFMHAILSQGWQPFFLFNLVYAGGVFLMVSSVPPKTGFITGLAFIFIHFLAASSWFFYRWRLGMETPVIFGIVLSVIIVSMGFSRSRKWPGKLNCEAQIGSATCSTFC